MPEPASRLRSGSLARRAERTDAWAATRAAILEIDAANQAYPRYVDRAAGAHIWDVDGNRFIDCIMGYGPVVLGHAHPEVIAAAMSSYERGVCMSPLWTAEQVDLTELLTEVIPGAQQAYLMKTGSDATSAAVRLARIYTGRELVVKWGYNGWHDWTAPRPMGVPSCTRAQTMTFSYNDAASLTSNFERHPDEIACVIMMPFELDAPSDGFLHAVRSIAHSYGALFILDEMRTGFRLALGGAQEFFDVRADLATFSKAMANGHPISAVVGRADILSNLAHTHMSSTFYANPAEMAAALTTIKLIRDNDVASYVWARGEELQRGLRAVLEETGLQAEVVGYPIAPFLRFPDDRAGDQTKQQFYAAALAAGVLLHPNHQWFLSWAHTPDDVDEIIAACRDAALQVVQ
jgi:glutamate-1-semialdehyde aminotransferase